MAPTPKSLGPYGFHPLTEAALATLCSSRPAFYARIGAALDPDSLVSVPARWSVKAVQEIVRETGNPPGSAVLVLQRLQRWSESGKVLYEEVAEVNAMFDAAEDVGLPAEDGLLAEVVPVVQKRLQHLRTLDLISSHDPSGLDKVIAGLEEVTNLGRPVAAATIGSRVGSGTRATIQSIRNLERLSVGVMELDRAMNEGLWRGALGLAVGGTGAGKSVMLSHIAAESLLGGKTVLLATLELPQPMIHARIAANLLGQPIDALLNGGSDAALSKLEAICSLSKGDLVVNDFAPHTTTVKDLRLWVDSYEKETGRKVDLLAVDYADKLASSLKDREEKSASQYAAQRDVYQNLRALAVDKNIWLWTASQARRQTEKKSKTYKLDSDDVSDSLHKSREADLIVTINVRDDGKNLLFHVPKNRMGTSGESAGPIPHDFSLGRIGPVNR